MRNGSLWRRLMTVLLLALALMAPVGMARADSVGSGTARHIHASLVSERGARPGETIMLALVMEPQPGWHGYWSNPGDAGLPLTLDWTLPKGATTGTPQFPVPQTLVVAGLMNHVYEHAFAVLVPLTIPRDATPGTLLPIATKAQWLACTTTICVPEGTDLSGIIPVAAPDVVAMEGDPRFVQWRAALPAPLDRPATFAATRTGFRLAIPFPASARLDHPHFFISGEGLVDYAAPQTYARANDVLIVDLVRPRAASTRPPATISGVLALGGDAGGVAIAAHAGPVPSAGTPIDGGPAPFSWRTLAIAVLGALAGGLVLNVMPCVFPILSLKALALARGNNHRAHVEGLAYSAGVILACLVLGAVMLGLRTAGAEIGWAFQLQDPAVVALLLLLALAITANFAGLFELPSLSFSTGAPGHGGAAGAFGTGLLAAFVATPCTGPFMAAAMGAALVLPIWAALGVFAALGLGLALPFLLIGFVPALRAMLPRPGAWMNTFRRAMAVPMGLTVLALGWLAFRLGGQAYAGATLALGVVLVLLLRGIGQRQRRGLGVARELVPALLALTALALVGTPRLAAAQHHDEAGVLGAQPFSEAALSAARSAGKPVFIYFTADWCLTCKVNENLAIETDTTRAAFARAGVVTLIGDWTRRDDAITRFLTSQGAAGVPLYLWYAPRAKAPDKLPQVLTPQTLAGLATKA